MAGVPAGLVDGILQSVEDSTLTTKTASHFSGSEQTLSPTSPHGGWEGLGNGSLPVAVPTHQAGPGFHHVESSTTDSGVSNASSVTSDCVPHLTEEMSLAATELPLELLTAEGVLQSRGTDDCGEAARVSGLPVLSLGSGDEERGEGEDGEREESDEIGDGLRKMRTGESVDHE